MSLAPGSPGQTFTVDVFVSVFGEAIHTDPSTYGLEEVHIRGYSDTSSGSAFATGAGVGVTSKAPFPVAPGSGFVQSDVTGPATIADNGSTTSGVGIISSTLDGIIDFGLAPLRWTTSFLLTHRPCWPRISAAPELAQTPAVGHSRWPSFSSPPARPKVRPA